MIEFELPGHPATGLNPRLNAAITCANRAGCLAWRCGFRIQICISEWSGKSGRAADHHLTVTRCSAAARWLPGWHSVKLGHRDQDSDLANERWHASCSLLLPFYPALALLVLLSVCLPARLLLRMHQLRPGQPAKMPPRIASHWQPQPHLGPTSISSAFYHSSAY